MLVKICCTRGTVIGDRATVSPSPEAGNLEKIFDNFIIFPEYKSQVFL